MKKLFGIMTALVLILSFLPVCFAADLADPTLPRVLDFADVLSDSEEKLLEDTISSLTEKHGFDILILIDDEHGRDQGWSQSEHDEYDEWAIGDFWDEYNYGAGADRSGWAMFVCLNNGYLVQSSTGAAQEYHNEDTQNIIDDFMYEYLSKGQFYEAFAAGLSELDSLFTLGPDEYYKQTYSPLAPDPLVKPEREENSLADRIAVGGGMGVLAGIFAGFAGVSRAKRGMKSVAGAADAGEYGLKGSLKIYNSDDILLDISEIRTVNQINRPSGGGGGGMHHSGASHFSGSHVGHSGTSHTSGGRHF